MYYAASDKPKGAVILDTADFQNLSPPLLSPEAKKWIEKAALFIVLVGILIVAPVILIWQAVVKFRNKKTRDAVICLIIGLLILLIDFVIVFTKFRDRNENTFTQMITDDFLNTAVF